LAADGVPLQELTIVPSYEEHSAIRGKTQARDRTLRFMFST